MPPHLFTGKTLTSWSYITISIKTVCVVPFTFRKSLYVQDNDFNLNTGASSTFRHRILSGDLLPMMMMIMMILLLQSFYILTCPDPPFCRSHFTLESFTSQIEGVDLSFGELNSAKSEMLDTLFLILYFKWLCVWVCVCMYECFRPSRSLTLLLLLLTTRNNNEVVVLGLCEIYDVGIIYG